MQRRHDLQLSWCSKAFTAACLATLLACGGSPGTSKTPASTESPTASSSASAERVPLSKAEEQWIVELTNKLKSDNQPDDSEVNKAAKRISGAPGILVPLCGEILGPLLIEKSDFDLVSKLLVASAAALLETPEVSADLPKMTSSALVAVAQAYRAYREKTGMKVGTLETLEAQERNGELETWVRANWSTCPASVAMARAYVESQKKDAVILAPDAAASAGERPWGASVPNTEQEAKALELAKSIGSGSAKVAVLSEILVVGPGMYRVLLDLDKRQGRNDIASIGTPSTTIVPVGDKVTKMEMRSYLNLIDREALLKTLSFRGLNQVMGGGSSRPATDVEREFWYALIPIEIKGKPVTIIEFQGHIVVVYIENGTIGWLDILSEYSS